MTHTAAPPRESAPPHSRTIYPEPPDDRESGEVALPEIRFEAITLWHDLAPEVRTIVLLAIEGGSAQWRRFADLAPSPEIRDTYMNAAKAFDSALLTLFRAAGQAKGAVSVPMPGGGFRHVIVGDAPPLDPVKVAHGEAVLAAGAAEARSSRVNAGGPQ